MKEFIAKRRAHLVFGTGFLLALALNISIGFTSGQTFLSAIWNGLTATKPMDYVMFAAFWYSCAVHRSSDDWYSPLVSLNLSRTSNQR